MLLICLQIRAKESIIGLLKRLQIRAQIFPIYAFHVSYFMLQAGWRRQIFNKSKMMLDIVYVPRKRYVRKVGIHIVSHR
jgi:hypothetical protein